jgi:hypothetical protein
VTRRLALAAALLAATASAVHAQQTPAPAPAPASPDTPATRAAQRQAPHATAIRIAGRAPEVDGRLDDAAWAAAPVLTGLMQKDPKEGEPASERTEVRFLYDDQAIYVAARMHRADPSAIRAPVSRRDVYTEAETFGVSLDTYHDRRTAYTYAVTAAGARVDVYHPRDEDAGDDQYNPVWLARTARDSAGWTAEMRIPLSQLRFNPGQAQTWGLNVRRWMPDKEEDDYWVVVPRSVTAWASRFGELDGITGIHPARRIEAMPYVAASAALRQGVDPADPFHDPRESGFRTGADLKVGFGPNLTLDATVNPDFGQVDADPAEVNLSAYETFFSERRPFFIEGSQLLSGGGAGYFYSRRIGAAPHLGAAGDYVDVPTSSTILGAAKLTGRLPSGLSVGVLAAVTDAERARTFSLAADSFGSVRVEPATGYGVVRMQQELGKGGSTAGFIVTGVHRVLDDGTPLAARLDRDAVTGAVDWDVRLGGGTYEVSGALGFSRQAGDSLSILRLQRSSARYFQRPDADYVTLDPSRTALSGATASLAAQKVNGAHWLWTVGAEARSPGFELNDAGSQGSADYTSAFAELRYRETKPRGPFRRWAAYVTPSSTWTWGGTHTGGEYYLDFEPTWKNYWRSWHTAFYTPRTQSSTLTRGGPLAQQPATWAVINQLANSASARLRWNGRVYYGENELGTATYRLSGGVTVRAATQWQLSITPNYLRTTPVRQYVATFEGGPAATFGRTYVFAAVDRSELITDLRLTYLFKPDLSLELYAQPFASSGRYHSFGELPAAGAFRLTPLDGDTTRVARHGSETTVRLGAQSRTVADFNVRSFRSNAVVRWEWRPGSTLYVVWQQDRSGDRDEIAHVGAGSLLETLETAGNNFLAIKMTYWLPIH